MNSAKSSVLNPRKLFIYVTISPKNGSLFVMPSLLVSYGSCLGLHGQQRLPHLQATMGLRARIGPYLSDGPTYRTLMTTMTRSLSTPGNANAESKSPPIHVALNSFS